MAFPSGSSLFGAKPAGTGLFGSTTTTTQPSGGLFGQPQNQQQPATGLFGQPQQQQQQNQPSTTGTGLFAQPQPQQQQQPQQGTTAGLFGSTTQQSNATGGLFGQTNQQQNQTTGGSGLFGNTGTNQGTTGGLFGNTGANQGTGGGLFGNTATNQGTTGGLFGNTNTNQGTTGGLFGNTQNQGTNPSTTGGLFGSTNNTQQAASGGLFGSTQPQPSTGGLFGNTTNQGAGSNLFGSTNQGAAGGLFGSTNANQGGTGGLFGSANQGTQPTTGLFGSTAQPQAASGFGGFGMSKQPSQAPGLSANQQGNNPVIMKSTKFNDLPDNVRTLMENIDSHIQGRVQISKELHQRKLGEEPTKGQASIKQMHKELIDITSAIRNDSHTTQDLKAKVDQSVEDTVVAIRIIDAFRNPQGGSTYLKDHANFPLEYFTRIADQMKERLLWYKTTIEQIERKLSSSSAQSQTPQGIVQTLHAQHQTFLALASRTAALDAEVQKIKTLYTQLWRAKTGSVRDPFSDTPRSSETPDFGMSTLTVR